MEKLPRVLSIQSHVVHGHVGNKSVQLPLNLNNFEVDTINTVQKCTHNRYPHFTGTELSLEDFKIIVDGLRGNGILYRYDYIMTGYMRSAELLKYVCEIIREIKEKADHPVMYLCDPVMGDVYPECYEQHKRGFMYVPADLLPVYREQVLPLADILTPNQCELELLLNHKNIQINNDQDMKNALNDEIFHDKQIFVTSNLEMSTPEIVGYCKIGSENLFKVYKFINFRLPATFVGTGDLFSATLLSEVHHKISKIGRGNLAGAACHNAEDSSSGVNSGSSTPATRSRSNSAVFTEIDFTENIKNILWTMYHVVNTTFEWSKTCNHPEMTQYEKIELQLVRCRKEIDHTTRSCQRDFSIQEI